jgi:hypothetical protein
MEVCTMKNNKKRLIICGIIAVFIITGGIFSLSQNPGYDDTSQIAGDILKDIAADEISTADNVNIPGITPTETTDNTVIIISPAEIQTGAVSEQNDSNIELTIIEEDELEPPELPAAAFIWEESDIITPEDVQAYEALDSALKNPDVKPNSSVYDTPEPGRDTSLYGTINEKGEIYVPGFGWIPDGGANKERISGASEEDWDWTQIGSMG